MDTKETISIFGRPVKTSDAVKLAGLAAFFVLIAVIIRLLWPIMHGLFEAGSMSESLNEIRALGLAGYSALLGLQFLQVVVAFIPGEAVQIIAGLLYGPWIGALIIWIGCILSSAFIFVLVKNLGAPFVRDMVSQKHMESFRRLEEKRGFNYVVFILFLIPGLPKDVFTYLVPLTDMPLKTFLLISNTARIPGIVVSTYAANSLAQGDYLKSAVIFAVALACTLIGLLLRKKIMCAVREKRPSRATR